MIATCTRNTIIKHPDGRYVQVIDGDSATDFWFWREVRRDGTLAARIEYGPGWTLDDIGVKHVNRG